MPKRLLRYALSRLELLEEETLDMDNLEFALGRNTVFEFKDVGVRLKASYTPRAARCYAPADIDVATETRTPPATPAILQAGESSSLEADRHHPDGLLYEPHRSRS